jgi:hypothetical protein
MMKTFSFAVAIAAFYVAATGAYAGESCLQMNMIDGWGAHDAHSVVVNDRYGKKYLLTLDGWCQDVDFAFGLSVHSFGGNDLSCVSRGDWVVPHGGAAMPAPGARCYISKIEPYTLEMEKAYREAKAAKTAGKAAPEMSK